MTMTMQEKLDTAYAEIRKMRLTGEIDLSQLSGIETILIKFLGEYDTDRQACQWAAQSIDLIHITRQVEMLKRLPNH